jgi:hypothetical protein
VTPLLASPTLTVTPSPPPAAASATATPAGSGTLRILAAVAFPQPNPRELRVQLDGPADRLWVERYSPAYVLLERFQVSPLQAGWNRVTLPYGNVAAGLSFVRLRAEREGAESPSFRPVRIIYVP